MAFVQDGYPHAKWIHGWNLLDNKGKAFYYVRDFSKCVTLHLKGHEYSKVVIEVDDKQATAERLRKMLLE